jgi:hypothetical protein
MRILAALVLTALAGCAPAPPPAEQPRADLTAADWYAPTIEQLAALNSEAEQMMKAGRYDEASAAIVKGQPLQSRLLEASQPTLAAMKAVADLDDLYGRMLLHNKQYGWARSMFQKNVTRWKHWKPESAETEQRLRVAMSQVAECDRRLTE